MDIFERKVRKMLKDRDVLSLEGKVAAVTGAASGIGYAAAELLAKFGAQVVLLDVNEAKGEASSKKIVDQGGEACFMKCDVTSEKDCKTAIEEIKNKFGRLDILHNNAGIIIRKTVVELDEKEWDLAVDVCLK